MAGRYPTSTATHVDQLVRTERQQGVLVAIAVFGLAAFVGLIAYGTAPQPFSLALLALVMTCVSIPEIDRYPVSHAPRTGTRGWPRAKRSCC